MSKNIIEIITIDPDQMEEIGKNILAGMIGDILVLAIDTGREIGPSSSGKMMGVASTEGFAKLPNNLRGNIYIGRKV